MRDVTWAPEQLSPLALAFIGDAVWEVLARNHCLAQGIQRPHQLHAACTHYVSAKAQAFIAQQLATSLTPQEQDLVRRGRNAKPAHSRRNTDVQVYRYSTGWEMLIGYLYGVGQTDRVKELAAAGFQIVDEHSKGKGASK